MATEAKRKANDKYNKKNSVLVPIRLNKQTDKDIIYHLETVNSKGGYIKDLIRKDMNSLLDKRKEMLREWNEQNGLDDKMYYLDVRRYNEENEEVGGDPVYLKSDDLEEIEKAFDHEVSIDKNSKRKGTVIKIKRAAEVYDNNLYYETIKKQKV